MSIIHQLDELKAGLADRYAIGHMLGRGGMATVYLARDIAHDRDVAIKVLLPELTAAMGSERFLREIEIAGRLRHPNLVPVLDSGAVSGHLFYVMPYSAGETLRQRLDREKQVPVDEAIQIAREVAGALEYAHKADVVHRDVKPENIMLEDGRAIVTDFGIARAIRQASGPKLTQTGVSVGTPAYMSPEQASGEAVDQRCDVYGLGCVLYEMLAGAPPFTGASSQAIMARHSMDPVPRVRTVRPSVPAGVQEAIERALAKVPADRFATASQFAEALVRPPSVSVAEWTDGPPAQVPVRRARQVAAGVGVVTLAALAALGGRALWRDAPASATERASILVAAPIVTGPDTTLGPIVMTSLESAMLESKSVRIVGRQDLEAAIVAAQLPPDTRLDSATALQVAERAGFAAVVLPRVHAVGSGYLFSASLLRPGGARIGMVEAKAFSDAELLVAIDTLQRRIRNELGENAQDLADSRRLVELLTPSIAAVRAYARAQFRPGGAADMVAQREALEEAVRLDSTFVLALLELSSVRAEMGLDGLELLERVERLLPRLPAIHQANASIEIAYFSRDYEGLREAVAQLLSVIPGTSLDRPDHERLAYNPLALASLELGDFDGARRAIEHLAQSKDWAGVVAYNMALVAAHQGQRARTEAHLSRARELTDEIGMALGDAAIAGVFGEWPAAANVIQRATSTAVTPDVRHPALLAQGSIEAVRGKPRASREAFDRAMAIAEARNDSALMAGTRLQLADAAFFALDDPARATAALVPLLTGSPPTRGVLRRHFAHARATLAAICATAVPVPPTAIEICQRRFAADSARDALEFFSWRGWDAIAARRLSDAIAAGSNPAIIRAGGRGLRARAPQAFAYRERGMPDSATALLERMATTPFGWLGNASGAWVTQSYALQRLAEGTGSTAERARRELARRWADAEPEFRQNVAARVLRVQ